MAYFQVLYLFFGRAIHPGIKRLQREGHEKRDVSIVNADDMGACFFCQETSKKLGPTAVQISVQLPSLFFFW